MLEGRQMKVVEATGRTLSTTLTEVDCWRMQRIKKAALTVATMVDSYGCLQGSYSILTDL